MKRLKHDMRNDLDKFKMKLQSIVKQSFVV